MSKSLKRSRAEHAQGIIAEYVSTVEGILRCGKRIIEAKEDLDHGQFGAMIELDLPFNRQTAFKLMTIARDHRFVSHGKHLPPAWTTLYELTKVDDDDFYAAIEAHVICPEMQRRHVRKVLDGWRTRLGLTERCASILLTVKSWPREEIKRLVDELQGAVA